MAAVDATRGGSQAILNFNVNTGCYHVVAAPKATIFRALLAVSDVGRQHYGSHTLTLAQHPSETTERMMVRLLAFALHANEQLVFTRGLCADDEPELWQKALNGDIELWIELGQADEKRLRKACARAEQVVLYTYQGRAANVWWQDNQGALARCDNLMVRNIPDAAVSALGGLVQRQMALQCTMQDDHVWLSDAIRTVEFELATWKPM
jgi:uncharacterized protein YaeQ